MSRQYLSQTPLLNDAAKQIQALIAQRGWADRLVVRHWMNRRVAQIRAGRLPPVPGSEDRLLPATSRVLQGGGA